jgi:hypothetical protein
LHPATGVNVDAVDQVQTSLRRHILRAFAERGLLESWRQISKNLGQLAL